MPVKNLQAGCRSLFRKFILLPATVNQYFWCFKELINNIEIFMFTKLRNFFTNIEKPSPIKKNKLILIRRKSLSIFRTFYFA